MANYAVNDFTESADTISAALALLETQIETIEDAKTIRMMSIHKVGNKYAYALVVDA